MRGTETNGLGSPGRLHEGGKHVSLDLEVHEFSKRKVKECSGHSTRVKLRSVEGKAAVIHLSDA